MDEKLALRKKWIQDHLKMVSSKRQIVNYTNWEINFFNNIKSLTDKGFWDLSQKQFNTLKFLTEKETNENQFTTIKISGKGSIKRKR